MIPPRLRSALVRMFIHRYEVQRGPDAGKIRVRLGDQIGTNAGHIRATDLRTLERKGFVTYSLLEHMTQAFGINCWDVHLTDAGKEEIADDFAAMCAEADEKNGKRVEGSDLFDRPFVEDADVDEAREGQADRAEARARQRAAKS